jgi:hypothetical protein
MKRYPLLFTFYDKVEGEGFLATVTTQGRALAVHEADDTWSLYGVEPGAIAACGKTILEAHADFRRTLTGVLYDFAAEARADFEVFRRLAERFFYEADGKSVAEWKAAVDEVRAGTIRPEEVPVKPGGIRTEDADSKRGIFVEARHEFRPAGNVLDVPFAIAA